MSETAKLPKPPAPAANYGPFVRAGQLPFGEDGKLAERHTGKLFNVASSFDALPQAMNGASDLIADLFGAKGRHARNTVGVSHIPLNALAEVEAVFEIKP
jgi:hypothetical protein